MTKSPDIYEIGNCIRCKLFKALKNGLCSKCGESKLPQSLKEIFGL